MPEGALRSGWMGPERRKVALRLLDLVEAIIREPFRGVGKP